MTSSRFIAKIKFKSHAFVITILSLEFNHRMCHNNRRQFKIHIYCIKDHNRLKIFIYWSIKFCSSNIYSYFILMKILAKLLKNLIFHCYFYIVQCMLPFICSIEAFIVIKMWQTIKRRRRKVWYQYNYTKISIMSLNFNLL